MVARVICCCALCAWFGSPAAASQVVIQDGDYIPRLNIARGDSLLMTGGRVDVLTCGEQFDGYTGTTEIAIAGGDLRNLVANANCQVSITGLDPDPAWPVLSTSADEWPASVTVHGASLHELDRSLGQVVIHGWLAGDRFAVISFYHDYARWDPPVYPYLDQVQFTYTSDGVFHSADGDATIDLEDLNLVRNSFGATLGPADLDHSGVIDLGDLNFVRNHFGETWETEPVPEPAAWWLLACGIVGYALASSTTKRWQVAVFAALDVPH